MGWEARLQERVNEKEGLLGWVERGGARCVCTG